MDLIGLLIVVTFLALLITVGIAFPIQRPPTEVQSLRCPHDQRASSVSFSWDAGQQAVCIQGCDHSRWHAATCRQECRPDVERRFPIGVPITVLP